MLKATEFPCLDKERVVRIINLDATILNEMSDLTKIDFLNTTIDAVNINGNNKLTYDEFLQMISDLDNEIFVYRGNKSLICLYSKPGTGKTMLCKKLANDLVLDKRNRSDIYVRMITTSELTANPDLNILIENAYSRNILDNIISNLEPGLRDELRRNYPSRFNDINIWIRKIANFLEEFKRSKNDLSLNLQPNQTYLQLIENNEDFKIDTENYLEFRIKTLLRQTNIFIARNLILDIINSEIEIAKNRGFRYVLITLDDAIIGLGEKSVIVNTILSNINNMSYERIPEGLDGFLFIFGITFTPPTTTHERTRVIFLNLDWVNDNNDIFKYLKSKLNYIIDDDKSCEKCAHENDCKKNLSEIIFSEEFINKWIDYEWIQKISREDRTPRKISELFGIMLLDYIEGKSIIQNLRKEFHDNNLTPFNIEASKLDEILNFLNLIFWYGESAGNNEYKLSRDIYWILKSSDNELKDGFKTGIIYLDEDYIYTSVRSLPVNFDLESTYIKNQFIEIILNFRQDIGNNPNKTINVSYKKIGTREFNLINLEDNKYFVNFSDVGSYLIKVIVKVKFETEDIEFKHEKTVNVEDFPLIIDYPKNSVKFLQEELEDIIITTLDPTVRTFTLNCIKPDGTIKKTGPRFLKDETSVKVKWKNFIHVEDLGDYKIFLSIQGIKKGNLVKFSIFDNPIQVNWKKDVDSKKIIFNIDILGELADKIENFEDNFEITYEEEID